ncbi:putative RNA-directed DNA polymerase from transposon X-element [Trichonephila clavipes]|nr:putative RNA-directed DNA polymerase from transposon X-element [Trichonephila clavipes]
MDPNMLCPGKGLVLPTTTIHTIATHSRFLILSLPNNEMSQKSPFALQKALKGIGGDPKSVKKLRSGDLLIETVSALQSKSFLLVKTFIDPTLTVTPHKSLNSCRGVISEPDLLCASEAEIFEGLFDLGVTQVRRITILRDSTRLPTKHIILTFNSPKLPTTIKAGYLNCKMRPYVPNPLRCFKCQRFGHSQTSCRGQLTCSRCASVGHASTDCVLEPKCVNCLQPHPSDSKMCPKWKIEKQIQEIKTNKNISYPEARKLIVPQLTPTYAQAAESSTINNSTQTDGNITKIKCPPLQLLPPLSSVSQPSAFPSIPSVSTLFLNTSASSLSAETRPLTTSNKFAVLSTKIQPLIPLPESVPTTSNSEHSNAPENPQCVKRNSRNRRKCPKVQEAEIEIKMAPHRPRKSAPTELTTDDEDMITYDVEEEELEPDPAGKFPIKEDPLNFPKGYLHSLTPSRYRNSRG